MVYSQAPGPENTRWPPFGIWTNGCQKSEKVERLLRFERLSKGYKSLSLKSQSFSRRLFPLPLMGKPPGSLIEVALTCPQTTALEVKCDIQLLCS